MKTSSTTTTSTGHQLAESAYLDSHFEAMKPEYEAMIRWVGIKPGWRVLDAGCGGGSYLSLLAELVGAKNGHIVAYDLAPENIEEIESRVKETGYSCSVETQVGSVTTLPFEDNGFDSVWCANTSQYLDDDELSQMLTEFRRVTRPGGLVAVKELDLTFNLCSLLEPTVLWHFYAKRQEKNLQTRGVLRASKLPALCRKAGLINVRFKSFVSERTAPLRPAEDAYIRSILQHQARGAEEAQLPDEHMSAWRKLANDDALSRILKDPDFYFREGHIVTVGEAPEENIDVERSYTL